MIVHRITHSLYKDDLSGTGAKKYGARWNQRGSSMLYTAEHISLCALEMLVHIGMKDLQRSFHLVNIFIPDEAPIRILDVKKLKTHWMEDEEYTAFIGSSFVKENQQLALKVPSAVIPEEYNYLINPSHPDFNKVRIKRSKPFLFDERLHAFK
ncbi:MAG: RES family NAD+ phosphorylase [Chitinophagaceae bacterium]|nr:RES family NAD+ phosphorylase [Chitinophagaceae bacterium]